MLAGGRSSRFGSDKAEAVFRGRKLIDWSIAALNPHCDMILVSGRDHSACRRVSDRPENGLGPLGGLAGAMQAAGAAGFTHVLSLPCDTPDVPEALLEDLCRSNGAYAAASPVIGLWPTVDGERLEAWLAEGRPKAVRAWAEANGYVAVASGPILNINRIADMQDRQ